MAEAAKLVNNVDASNPMPLTATFVKPPPNISKLRSSLAKTFITGRNAFIHCWTCMELSSLFPLPKLMSLLMPVNFNKWV